MKKPNHRLEMELIERTERGDRTIEERLDILERQQDAIAAAVNNAGIVNLIDDSDYTWS